MLDPYQSPTFGNALLLHVDGAIGAMSLSPNGRDAVLAGRRGLFIIDLDDPFKSPRWLHHITSWEVADVQWSPHFNAKPLWCISTLNQKALLWDLARPSNNAILSVLHSHLRAITDINFHPQDPEVFVTCSVDTNIFVWDMRTPRRPVSMFSEWRAAAIQTKWNHMNPFEIASAHDNDIYVWDTRKGALPIIKIAHAHDGKINGLDFSGGMGRLILCSNDHTVKLWNLQHNSNDNNDTYTSNTDNNYNNGTARNMDIFRTNASIDPAVVIHTDFPIARARPLAFGDEKSCGIMPLRGGNDSIYIVNFEDEYQDSFNLKTTIHRNWDPDYTFEGNNRGLMKDFLWRTRQLEYLGYLNGGSKDHQLVTWLLQNCDLTLWPEDEELYEVVGYHPKVELDSTVEDLGDNGSSNIPDSLKQDDILVSKPVPSFETPSQVSTPFSYNTYCIEPPATVGDFKGDPLLAITMYQILRRNRLTNSLVNHLDWISGVRLGRTGEAMDDDSGPSNLGEEVSVVGHKFPKVRFEKISVSTGEIIVSLRGPVPEIENKDKDERENSAGGENEVTKSDERQLKMEILSNQSEDGDSLKPQSTTGAPSTIVPLLVPTGTGTNNNNNSNTTSNVAAGSTNVISSTPVEEKLAFIRMDVRFPKNYPHIEEQSETKQLARFQKHNIIKFNIEETHEISKAVKSEMLTRLREIANFYSNRHKRFCLEACLRYLMGEKVDLSDLIFEDEDEIIHEIGSEGWADDLINPDERCNPEDDINKQDGALSFHQDDDLDDENDYDIIPREAGMQNLMDSLKKHFSLGDSGIIHPKLARKEPEFDLTPLPKGCGALWLPTGQLVCFFIPKKEMEEENKSFQKLNFFKFTDGGYSVNASSHHQHHSHSRDNSKTESFGEYFDDKLSVSEKADSFVDSDASQLSDAEDNSSSSDESFADDLDEILRNDMPLRLRIPDLFKTAVGLGNGVGRNSQTNGNLLVHDTLNILTLNRRKRKNTKQTNIVGIFDLRHLLPDNYDLACEYRVLGDLPENLARYNSQVALKYGFTEISDVWKILEKVLIKDVVISDMPIYNGGDNQTEAQKEVLDIYEKYNNSVREQMYEKGNNYRFFWGSHPFGHSWLVNQIFEFFEARGNIQMLAMLGCILYENLNNLKRNDSNMIIPIHTPYGVLPPIEQIRQQNQQQSSFSGYPRKLSDEIVSLVEGSLYQTSRVSSFDGSSMKDNILALSHRKSFQGQLSELDEIPSPKIMKSKTTNGVFTNSRNSSRRNTILPLLNAKNNEQYRIGGNLSHHGSVCSNLRNLASVPLPTVTIEMRNTADLDLYEDNYSKLLLSSQDSEKIKRYREQYADLLYLWGLPISRIKILKFNYSDLDEDKDDDHKATFISDEHKCGFGVRNLRVILKKGQVWTPQANPSKFCSLCSLLVVKRLVVCTNCEHVLHAHCALTWWSEDNFDEQECPTGCGCQCLLHRL